VSFSAITTYIASQLVFVVVVYFVIGSVRKLIDTPSTSQVFIVLEYKRWCAALKNAGK
jgi:uncharacterized protein HemY